jgi:hypothetical protein
MWKLVPALKREMGQAYPGTGRAVFDTHAVLC